MDKLDPAADHLWNTDETGVLPSHFCTSYGTTFDTSYCGDNFCNHLLQLYVFHLSYSTTVLPLYCRCALELLH